MPRGPRHLFYAPATSAFPHPTRSEVHKCVPRLRLSRRSWFPLLLVVFLPALSTASTPTAATPDAVTSKAMTVLAENCLACHTPAKHKGDFILASRAAALKGGKGG